MIGVGQRISWFDRWNGQIHHAILGLVKDSLGMTCGQSSCPKGFIPHLCSLLRCPTCHLHPWTELMRGQVLVSAH